MLRAASVLRAGFQSFARLDVRRRPPRHAGAVSGMWRVSERNTMSKRSRRASRTNHVMSLLMGAAFIAGCYSENDVTHRAKYQFGYQPNTTYVILQDVTA